MNLQKTAILCPIWKRRELLKLVLKHYRKLQPLYGFGFFASVSELHFPYELLDGWAHHKFLENNPIGHKLNELARMARAEGYDQAIIIGSDDFLSREIFDYYAELELKPRTFYGFSSLHFYRVRDDLLTWWSLHSRFGLGRVLPLDIFEHTHSIWQHLDKGLDNSCWKTYIRHGYNYETICSRETAGMLLDVKFTDNISPHAIVQAGQCCDVERLYDYFPSLLVDEIRNLHFYLPESAAE